MKLKRIFPALNAVVAIAAGVIVLLGYFITPSGPSQNPSPLTDFANSLAVFRIIILQWSVLLAGIAVIIGIGNLFAVHWQKITQRKPDAIYSLVLLVFFFSTFILVLIVHYSSFANDLDTQKALLSFQNIFLNGIMVPVEISLMAILAVTLLYSGMRMLRWRIDLKTILFLVSALLALMSMGPLTSDIPFIRDVIQVISTGGARGILIGVALGTLTTGLRILLGADRPYGGK